MLRCNLHEQLRAVVIALDRACCVEDGHERGVNAQRRSGGDENLRSRIVGEAVIACQLHADRVPQPVFPSAHAWAHDVTGNAAPAPPRNGAAPTAAGFEGGAFRFDGNNDFIDAFGEDAIIPWAQLDDLPLNVPIPIATSRL